mmetsp:Transcript_8470/g.12544  ORF Transcript_8470/g.12544 Transcript_8470/m.12544 type:complete len:329 (-) Transcript_8470:116-1102(-)|eukprot:CAMPEP_0196816404 /NCGR_PEP_ID=MMETSP1362-20130617/55156_1 /TAXON_ID=163516 /ORGANISM="Leptocylindrus danicus, Strain CCMP1856" /LENGTH=328 /DNA_ID=CAMNT_0042193727 /DNA_START=28 /DNA_END=1014 /DNA_ORIENTATION=-
MSSSTPKTNHEDQSLATRTTKASECHTPEESRYNHACGDGWFSGMLSLLCAVPGTTQQIEQSVVCETDYCDKNAKQERSIEQASHPQPGRLNRNSSKGGCAQSSCYRNEQDEIVREILNEADDDHRDEGIDEEPLYRHKHADNQQSINNCSGSGAVRPSYPSFQSTPMHNCSSREAFFAEADMMSIGRHNNDHESSYPDMVSTPSRTRSPGYSNTSGFSYSVMSGEDKIVTSIAEIMGCNAPLDEAEFIDEDIPQPPPLNSLTLDENWNDLSFDSDLTDNSFLFDLPPPPPPKSRGVFEVMLDTLGDKNICAATGKILKQQGKNATDR